MRTLFSDVRRRLRLEGIGDGMDGSFESQKTTHTASVVAKNLISIQGQTYDAAVDNLGVGARVEVVNAQRSGAALYAPKTGGGVAVMGGGSSAGSSPPGGGGSSVPSPHGLSSSHHSGTLVNAQAPQFLLVDGTRTLTGNLAVTPGVTFDGVDVSAFKAAYDIHITLPDVHHNRVTVSPGLLVSAAQLVSVDLTYGFVWTGMHQFRQDIQLNANLDFTGGDRYITTAPGGDLIYDLGVAGNRGDLLLGSDTTFRSADYFDGIPITGFSFFINSGGHRQLTIDTIKSDELRTRLFVADAVRIDEGEEFWSKSRGIAYAAFTTPSAFYGTVPIIFEDNPAMVGPVFSVGDWLQFRYLDDSSGFAYGSVWGTVSGYVNLGVETGILPGLDTGRGRQQWTFTLRDGAFNQIIGKGAVSIDFGTVGQGYIHLSTLQNTQGPWFRIGQWDGATPYAAGSMKVGTQIGRLDNISDITLNPTGYGLYSTNAYLRGMLRTAETIMDDDGFSLLLSDTPSDISPGVNSYIGWFYDVDDRDTIAPARLSASRVMGVPGSEHNMMLMEVANFYDAYSEMRLRAIGLHGSTQIILNSEGTASISGNLVRISGNLEPWGDNIWYLGSGTNRWKTIYADQIIVTGSISGTAIGGQEWQYNGNMVIDANFPGDSMVTITNQGSGQASLTVEKNIVVGGTVDGVDLSAHVADVNIHHDKATAGAGISITPLGGQVIAVALGANPGLSTVSGLVVLLAANSGLSTVGGLAVAASFAGSGLALAAGVMSLNNAYVLSTVMGQRTIETRNGLIGGGTLDNDLVLDVAVTGGGLRLNDGLLEAWIATDGGLNSAAGIGINSSFAGAGLQLSAGVMSVNPLLAGAGMTHTAGVLNVIGGGGINVAPDAVSVNQAYAFAWTGAHTWALGVTQTFNGITNFNFTTTFNTTTQHYGNINFQATDRSITAGFGLTIAPNQDLILAPGGQDVLPSGSGEIDLGDYNRKWRSLYVSELIAETLVAQDVMATIGGRIIVAPTSVLVAVLGNLATDTTIHVKHTNIFAVGDYLRLQTAPAGVLQIEVLKVTANTGGVPGDYTYTVERDKDGSGRNAWEIGDAIIDLGSVVGTGYLELTSTATIHGHSGPTITMYGRTANVNWNDVKPLVSMGNLESFVDYSTTAGFQYGFAVGNDLTLNPAGGFSGITVDRDKGLRLFNTIIEMYEISNMVVAIDKSRGISFEAAPPLSYGAGVPWRYPRNISWYVDLDDLTVPIVNDPPIVNYRPPVAVIGVAVNGTVSYNMSITVLGDSYATPARTGLIELRSTGATLTLGGQTGYSFSLPFLASRGDIYGGLDGVRIGDSDYTVVMSTLNVHEITTTTGVAAGVKIQQGGTGDSVLRWHLTGGQYYSMGIDNSDSDNWKISRGNELGTNDVFMINSSGWLYALGTMYMLPPVHPTNSSTTEVKFMNRTASYLTSGTHVLGKITSMANIAWNSNYSGANVINASEIEFLYTAAGDGRVMTQTIGFNIQADYSGALARAATLTANNLHLHAGGYSSGHHPNGYTWTQKMVSGYYVNGSRLNLVAFSMGGYQGFTIRVTYSQFNTGAGSEELVMGLGTASITHDATPTTGFYVGNVGYVGTQHLTIGWQFSGHRVLFWLARATGTGIRPEADFRWAYVEILGGPYSIVWSPSAI